MHAHRMHGLSTRVRTMGDITEGAGVEFDTPDRADLPRAGKLTGKEIECLRRCKEGDTNGEIAIALDVSEKTVEFHLTNAMRKLGARNRVSAVVAAIRGGLFPL